MVSSVQDKSPAALDDSIQPGDKLLAINGLTARELTMDEIFRLLQHADTELKLDVARGDAMPFVCRLRSSSTRWVLVCASGRCECA